MSENQHGNRRLDSWKEIAAHLGRDVRTAIRWEKEKRLPVHRVPGGQRQAVFAYQEELDAWLVSQDGKGGPSGVSNGSFVAPDVKSGIALEKPIPAVAQEDSTGRTGRLGKWILAVAGLSLAAGAVVLLTRPHPSAVRPLRIKQVTDDGRLKMGLRADGTMLYYSEFEGARGVLVSSPVDGGPVRPIETPFPNVQLDDLSNDGQNLLLTSYEAIEMDRPLWIMPVHGGTARRLGDVLCRFAQWSPDNRSIACISGTSIILLNADGTVLSRLGSFPSAPFRLIWDPRGSRLRFMLQDPVFRTVSPWEIFVSKEQSSGFTPASQLRIYKNCCWDWTWTRTGRSVVYVQIDANGEPAPLVASEDGEEPRQAELPFSVGRLETIVPGKTDSSLYVLVQTAPRGELLKFDSKQNVFQTLLHGLSAVFLSFSKDGQWMTYTSTLDNTLWRSRVDGTDAMQLTKPPLHVELSSWSPDGHQIAFMARRPSNPWRIFLVSPEGGEFHELTDDKDDQGAPSWSSDGKSLVYANVYCQDTSSCWIRRVDLATRKSEIVPGSHGFRTARWSPNGKYIAALQPESHDLMLFNIAEARWRRLAGEVTGDNINWSSDSQWLYVDSPRGGQPAVDRVRVRDGQRQKVADLATLQKLPGQLSTWTGLTPENAPILLHLFTASEVYSLDWGNR